MNNQRTPDTLLRLYLRADWPAQHTACDWELLGQTGARLQLGNSEPRHWPPSARCEIILSANQCLPLSINLPKGARARTPEVLGFALEERLLGEADAEHFTLGDSSSDGQTAVWIISRTRLQTLLALLTPLHRQPQRLYSELQLIPLDARNPGWSLCLKAQGGFVRTATESGFCFDLPHTDVTEPPLELQLALQSASPPPAHLNIHAEPGVVFHAEHAAAWQARLGIPVHYSGEYLWRDAASQNAQHARNLLSGEFTPPRARGAGWSSLRPAALLAALSLALYSLLSFAEWSYLERQKTHLRQQMTDQFRAAFPQAQTIVDPVLQMQRLYDQLRRERGQLGSNDFLPLLAATTEATSASGTLRQIDFDDGHLDLTLQLADAAAVNHLRDTLTRRGLGVVVRDTHPVPGKAAVEAIFAVRGSP